MTKKLGLIIFAVTLMGFGGERSSDPQPTSTDRKVHGVITSIQTANLTIASQQHAVTGRIDPVRTKVTIHGKPAKLADLQLSSHAKAELCLDDVWLAIDTH